MSRIAALSMLLAVGCASEGADEGGDTPDETTSPVPSGDFRAGTRRISAPGPDGLTLPVQVWYPTDAAEADVVYDGLVPGRAAVDAPPTCGGARPVVVFSHGNGGMAVQSPFFAEALARRGYVVAAPDHVGNTVFDMSASFEELVERRPLDVAATFDAVVADPDVGGCVDDAAGYGVSGHSFGGYTALAVAGAEVELPEGPTTRLADGRAWAVMVLAPWDAFGGITDGTSLIDVPTLFLTGDRDETTPIAQVRRLWGPLETDPRWLGVLPDGGHYSFSPVACVLLAGDGCGEGYVDPERVADLTGEAAVAFFDGARGIDGAYDALPLDADELAWE